MAYSDQEVSVPNVDDGQGACLGRVSCPHCAKSFADQGGLWSHVNAKHGRGLAKAVRPPKRNDDETMGEFWRAVKDDRRAYRDLHGRECPECPPNRCATILLPGQVCRVDGYRDPRPTGEA